MNHQSRSPVFLLVITLIALDIFTWYQIASGSFSNRFAVARDYFLDVGQGDSELIIFPGDIKVMTDAGPDDKVLGSLARVLPSGDDYIDLAIISHPQLDHFNGYNFILDHYHVGAFIYNGRDDAPTVIEWAALKAKIREKGIPFITLAAGDKIEIKNNISAPGADEIDLFSPSKEFDQSVELNDTGFVEFVKTPGFTTLLTADIGFNVEDWLIAQGDAIHADVLKVPHHGSAYSSGDAFLRVVNPLVAVIEVGAKNTYGQPASSTLSRLASSTRAALFRTDKNGTIEIYPENEKLEVVKEK